MKDLGYERTSTDAKYHVTMPDGSVWAVPVQVIADDRDTHYRDEAEDTIGFIRAGELDEYEIKDWAANNMNWSDVKAAAVPVPGSRKLPDYQEGWVNGKKQIVGKI